MVFRKIADECLLVPIRQNVAEVESIYVINEVGGRIWELIDGKRSFQDVVDNIVAEFEVHPPEAAADVLQFLLQLEALGGIKFS